MDKPLDEYLRWKMKEYGLEGEPANLLKLLSLWFGEEAARLIPDGFRVIEERLGEEAGPKRTSSGRGS